MNKRTVVTLDFRPCRYISQIYQEMRLKMKWDEDYGENLSALWDILWGMPYYGDDFLILCSITGYPMVRIRNLPAMWIKSAVSSSGPRERAF